jgi:hypothetical protein
MDKLIRQLQEIRLDEEDLFPNASPEEVEARKTVEQKRIEAKFNSIQPGDKIRLVMFPEEIGVVKRKEIVTTNVSSPIFTLYLAFPPTSRLHRPPVTAEHYGRFAPRRGESGAWEIGDVEKIEETPEDVEIEGVE